MFTFRYTATSFQKTSKVGECCHVLGFSLQAGFPLISWVVQGDVHIETGNKESDMAVAHLKNTPDYVMEVYYDDWSHPHIPKDLQEKLRVLSVCSSMTLTYFVCVQCNVKLGLVLSAMMLFFYCIYVTALVTIRTSTSDL